jgi:histidinol-phosphate aminotransferase
MNRFFSDTAKNLTPYIPGEQPKDGRFIKLNTNENPYPPAPGVERVLRELPADVVKLYPDPEATLLRAAIGGFYGVDPSWVFAGNGSDEVLAFLFQAFFGRGDLVAFPDITYSFYPVYAKLYSIPYVTVPLREDWSIDFSDYPAGLKGIVAANPNAPTSLGLSSDTIESLLRERPDTLVAVDEAYADFGGESVIPLTARHDNLIVVKTMSKSRSFAGLRVGYAIGNPGLVEGLVRVKDSFNSYPLDVVAQRAAAASFLDRDYFYRMRDKVVATRDRFTSSLRSEGIRVLDSKANFVFASVPGFTGGEVLSRLREKGVLVRHFNKPRLDGWVRITIGTDADMERVALLLAEMARFRV